MSSTSSTANYATSVPLGGSVTDGIDEFEGDAHRPGHGGDRSSVDRTRCHASRKNTRKWHISQAAETKLLAVFNEERCPTHYVRLQLAEGLGVREHVVRNWFQQRRLKMTRKLHNVFQTAKKLPTLLPLPGDMPLTTHLDIQRDVPLSVSLSPLVTTAVKEESCLKEQLIHSFTVRKQPGMQDGEASQPDSVIEHDVNACDDRGQEACTKVGSDDDGLPFDRVYIHDMLVQIGFDR
eukprot:CAMPEP_0206047016 /NCGR_PEP_ID=MMETSP1466-20131121/20117_1 /ASSEMBLY_ACC=CAM_ASM_001126 /TAXON_ID=44452 /ORGANISM="Pavlova gyrans, Strain CCMP608" /LENGTH=235 /DNA_ID=CAMNT_0053422021 /DNA_START=53 /DNA_END=757 /DNA_ORIENTATION=+